MINTVRNPAPSAETLTAATLSANIYTNEWPELDSEYAVPCVTHVSGETPDNPLNTLYISLPLQRNLWGSAGQQNLSVTFTQNTCYITFEGTARPETWLYNLDGVSPVLFGSAYPTISQPLVHPGFYNLMLEVFNQLLVPDFVFRANGRVQGSAPVPPLITGHSLLFAIADLYQQRGCPGQVIWTGHSAGAALANLSLAWLKGGNVPLIPRDHPFLQANHRVIDFGCPRFIHTSSRAPALPVHRERHVHSRDLVPHVPLGLSWTHWGAGNYVWGPKGQLYRHPILVHHSLQLLAGNVYHYLSGLLTGTLLKRILNNHAADTYHRFIVGKGEGHAK